MDQNQLIVTLLEKLFIPAVVGVIGWFVKDYLFAIYARREELVRKEWERRILEVWSPLYYWSGVVLFDDNKKGWERHGIKELEALLSKNGNLLPSAHYNNLIKLIGTLTGQRTSEPKLGDLKLTRKFIYGKIETLNYLLYRRSGWFDATTYTHFFATIKYLMRFISQALKHLVVWLLVMAFLGGLYLAYTTRTYWVLFLLVMLLAVPVLYDWYRQIRLHREIANNG